VNDAYLKVLTDVPPETPFNNTKDLLLNKNPNKLEVILFNREKFFSTNKLKI
jgi:hypothetical protein